MRKESLCDRRIGCPHETAGKRCPLDDLDTAVRNTAAGRMMARALRLLSIVNLGIRIDIEKLKASEIGAMLIVGEERQRYKRETDNGQ